jgi:uncharacterized protein YukE
MSITPKAIQDLLDELEASRQARRRAWDVLQDLRAVLTNLGNVTIGVPSRKTFEAEGAILKQALSDCLRDQRAALAQLADAARQVDKAAFGSTADFGPAHQALLKALDRAEVLLQGWAMCGRYRRTTREEELARIYRIPIPSQPDLPISYNIAPSQEVLAIRFNPETKQRSLDRLRWGLVPYWAKDEKIGFKTINARAETIDTAHSFRSAFKKRRCLIPADGF